MAEKKENTKIEVNPFLLRYPPNTRFTIGGFKDKSEVKIRKDNFGESVTDKESYRLNLASGRGALYSLGSSTVGRYMFEDGNYDAQKDFSYVMRKDLSIVQIDDYINELKTNRETADSKLKSQIDEQINLMNQKKEQLKESEKSNQPKVE